MGEVRLLRESLNDWFQEATVALQAEYPEAYVRADLHDTPAFALRAYFSVTRGDPATATEDVVVSVDVKRGEDFVSADVSHGSGEVLDLYEARGLDADAVVQVRAFLSRALGTARRVLA